MEQRVSMIGLAVADLERARGFYQDILGWHAAEGPPGIVFFDLGGLVLSLYPGEDLARDTGSRDHDTGARRPARHQPRPQCGRRGGGRRRYSSDFAPQAPISWSHGACRMGWVFRYLCRSRRPSLGDCPQPLLAPRGRRPGLDDARHRVTSQRAARARRRRARASRSRLSRRAARRIGPFDSDDQIGDSVPIPDKAARRSRSRRQAASRSRRATTPAAPGSCRRHPPSWRRRPRRSIAHQAGRARCCPRGRRPALRS